VPGTMTTAFLVLRLYMGDFEYEVLPFDEILDAVWGTDFVAESNVVDRHIRGLRVKLQNDYREPRFIATIPGRGYRFIPTFSNRGWDALDGPEHRQATERLSTSWPTQPDDGSS